MSSITVRSHILFTIATLIGLWALFSIRAILVLLFLAFILMSAINPLVTKLERRWKVPRLAGTLLLFATLVSSLVLAGFLIFPPLVAQLQNLGIYFTQLVSVQEQIDHWKVSATDFNWLTSQLGNSLIAVSDIISTTAVGVFTVFALLVISIFMVLERNRMANRLRWFTRKPEHIQTAAEFLDQVEIQLGGWVRGQLILMLVIGVIVYIGLTLLGVPYALPLALLAGLLEFIPNIGPTIAGLFAMAVAIWSTGGGAVLGGVTALFYILVQQFENYLIVPKIMQENVHVSPLTTIVLIMVGFQLGNFVGALLSLPLYVVIRTGYTMWRKRQ